MKITKRKIFISITMIFSAAVILAVTISFAWLAMNNDGDTQVFGSGDLKVTLSPGTEAGTLYNNAYINPDYKYLPGDELVITDHYEASRGEENKPHFNLSFSYKCDKPCVIRVSVTYTYEGQEDDAEPESAGVLNYNAVDGIYKVKDNETALLAVWLNPAHFTPVSETVGSKTNYYWNYKDIGGNTEFQTRSGNVLNTVSVTDIFTRFALCGKNIFSETGVINFTVTVSMRQVHPAVNWNNYTAAVTMGGGRTFARS